MVYGIKKNRITLSAVILMVVLSNTSYSRPSNKIYCKEDYWVSKVVGTKSQCTASSRLSSHGYYNYKCRNVLDKELKTSWCPKNNKKMGVDEFIIIRIPYRSRGIRLVNGIAKNRKLFFENNRVKQIYLGFITTKNHYTKLDEIHNTCYHNHRGKNKYILSYQTGTKSKVFLKDSMETQNVYFNKIPHFSKYFSWDLPTFEKNKKNIFLVIGILDLYRGTKYTDTCVSEIEIIK